MRITFDTEVDALTLVVSSEPVERTVDVRDGRFIDLDADGNIVALEILDASQGIDLRDLLADYDLQPLIEALIGQIETARRLWHEGADLREMVG